MALPQGDLTLEEFHAMLDVLAKGSEDPPNLPTESFTRESFHEDRANAAPVHAPHGRPHQRDQAH
jgi:hypothetical protein